MKVKLNVPATEKEIRRLKAGDEVYIEGTIYNVRQSLFKLVDMAEKGQRIPQSLLSGLKGGAIHYSGPLLDKKKERIMANSPIPVRNIPFSTIELVIKKLGIRIILAQDDWSEPQKMIQLLKNSGAVYLCTAIGCGAWYAYPKVKNIKNIYFQELGEMHACYELEVKNFGPTWVGIDAHGNSLLAETKKLLDENKRKMCQDRGWL